MTARIAGRSRNSRGAGDEWLVLVTYSGGIVLCFIAVSSRLRVQSRGCNRNHSGAISTAEIARARSGIEVARPGEGGRSCVAQPCVVGFLLIKKGRLLWFAPFPISVFFRGTRHGGLHPGAGAFSKRGAPTRPLSGDGESNASPHTPFQ